MTTFNNRDFYPMSKYFHPKVFIIIIIYYYYYSNNGHYGLINCPHFSLATTLD